MKTHIPLATVFLIASLLSSMAQAATDYGLVTATQGKAMRLIPYPGVGARTDYNVRYETDYYQAIPIAIGDDIKSGDIIKTDSDGKVRLIYDNGDSFHVAEGTIVKVMIPDDNASPITPELGLGNGEVRSIVSQTGPRNRLVIKTRSATMGVRGTDFIVSQKSDQGTEVNVLRGEVAMTTVVDKKSVAGTEIIVPIGSTGALPLVNKKISIEIPRARVHQISEAELDVVDRKFEIETKNVEFERLPHTKKDKINLRETKAVEMIKEEIRAYGLDEVLPIAQQPGVPLVAPPAVVDEHPGTSSGGSVNDSQTLNQPPTVILPRSGTQQAPTPTPTQSQTSERPPTGEREGMRSSQFGNFNRGFLREFRSVRGQVRNIAKRFRENQQD